MRKFVNKCVAFVANNPKKVLWSLVGTLGISLIDAGIYWWEKNQDTKSESKKAIEAGEIAARNKRVDAECDIMTTAAKTACKIMEQATSLLPDVMALKEELKSAKNEISEVKDGLAQAGNASPLGTTSSNENKNYDGYSSASLFNRKRPACNWLVDSYMKMGQINLVVAGAGVGKSNLVTMIAVAISKGICPEFLPPNSQPSPKLPCVYYRLEDFDDELEGKYGKGEVFSGCNIRWFLPENILDCNLTGFIAHLKEVASRMTEDTVVLIDPATKLANYTHQSFVMGVEEAMRIAKNKGYTLTPVVSIHLDEINDWALLTLEDIKGGDKAVQLAGSVIALRKERTGEMFRFIQCLKEPKGSTLPFKGDVLVCELVEQPIDDQNKYLHYKFVTIKKEICARPIKPKVQTTDEAQSTKENIQKSAPNQKVTDEGKRIIKEYYLKGMKPKKIREKLKGLAGIDICEKTISRHINELKKTGNDKNCA